MLNILTIKLYMYYLGAIMLYVVDTILNNDWHTYKRTMFLSELFRDAHC